MGQLVCMSAVCQCSFGTAPSNLTVLPTSGVMVDSKPVATIMDNVPFLNIAPFAMCTSMSNPAVAAATAKNLGVLNPMPCTPVPAGPWIVGTPTVMVGGKPALNESSKLMCNYGGVITITFPGQVTSQAS